MGSGVGLQGTNPKLLNVRFGSKADIATVQVNVRFTPKIGHWNSRAMSALCQKRTWVRLFNDVVGAGKQLLRHGQTKGLRCPKIDC
jgi:hypothetical protein